MSAISICGPGCGAALVSQRTVVVVAFVTGADVVCVCDIDGDCVGAVVDLAPVVRCCWYVCSTTIDLSVSANMWARGSSQEVVFSAAISRRRRGAATASDALYPLFPAGRNHSVRGHNKLQSIHAALELLVKLKKLR